MQTGKVSLSIQEVHSPLWNQYRGIFIGGYGFAVFCLIITFFSLLFSLSGLARFFGIVGIIIALALIVAGFLFSSK